MFTFKRNQVIITVLVFMIAIAAYLNTKEPIAGVKPNLVENVAPENHVEEDDFFARYDDVIQELPPDGETEAFAESAGKEALTKPESKETANNEAINNEKTNDTVTTNEVASNEVAISKKGNDSMNRFNAIITKKEPAIETSSEMNGQVEASKNMDVSYFVEEKMLRERSRADQVEQLTEYVANENLDKESKSKAAENLLAIQERIEKESSAEALLRAKGFKEVYVRIDESSVDVVINKSDLTDSDIAQIEEIVNRKTGYSVGKIKITPLKGTKTEKN